MFRTFVVAAELQLANQCLYTVRWRRKQSKFFVRNKAQFTIKGISFFKIWIIFFESDNKENVSHVLIRNSPKFFDLYIFGT